MSDTRRVPVTEEMIEAGRKAFAEALKIDAPEGWCLTHIYEAMAAVSANNSANLRDTETSPAISRDDELARLEGRVTAFSDHMRNTGRPALADRILKEVLAREATATGEGK